MLSGIEFHLWKALPSSLPLPYGSLSASLSLLKTYFYSRGLLTGGATEWSLLWAALYIFRNTIRYNLKVVVQLDSICRYVLLVVKCPKRLVLLSLLVVLYKCWMAIPGTLTSITNFASSISRNMERLSMDEEHIHRNEQTRRRRPSGLSEGLLNGLSGFGLSLLGINYAH